MANFGNYLGGLVNKIFGNFRGNPQTGNFDQSMQAAPGVVGGKAPKISLASSPAMSSSAQVRPLMSPVSPGEGLIPPPPQAQVSPQVQPSLADLIASGLGKFSNSPVPIASMSGQLAQAGQGLPDELLPTIMALLETGGGQRMTANNNLYNLQGTQDGRTKFIDYPDLQTAILGGNGSRGLAGTIKDPAGYYGDYLKSGNLEDFFKRFTPPGEDYGNPGMEELVARYNALREKLFSQQFQGGEL